LKKTVFLFTSALLSLLPYIATSQISYNPVSMGLGGGGTSYITDYEALFINPANLQLREKNYSLQITLGESGAYFDTPLRIRDGRERIQLYGETLQTPRSDAYMFSGDERQLLLNRYYNNNRQFRQMQSSSVVNWLGIKWFGEEKSYAFAVRTRQSSRYSVGRGFYDLQPIEADGIERINRSLTQRFQTLHEISFGYSESFTFISGLIPRISKFIIGLAPKIVVAGPGFATQYTNNYSRDNASAPWTRDFAYEFGSSGIFSRYADRLASGEQPIEQLGPINRHMDLMKPTGIGAAIDLGITYLFTFGDDLSLLRRGEEPTEKSLRLSFSVTDLGIVHTFEDPFRAESDISDLENAEPRPLSDQYYSGALLQDFSFLGNEVNGVHPMQTITSADRDSYQSLLPTSLQTGILFQINRIKLMGDFRLGLTDNAFHSTKLTTYIGTEIRPLPFLPLRAGTRFATDLPGYYSFGTGIETEYFDINAGLQFRSTSTGPTLEPVAASAVAVKFYIP
jgi:hypothetical protein